MTVLGLRCSPKGFAFVTLDGSRDSVCVLDKGTRILPQAATECEQLAWVRKEISEILTECECEAVAMKRAETNARKVSPKRHEIEGVIKEVVKAEFGIECKSYLKRQLKTALDFTQPARYLGTVLEEHDLEELSSAAYSEATLTALAELPE